MAQKDEGACKDGKDGKEEDILKLLAAIFEAAKLLLPTVVAGIKDITSFVKDLVTCSDLIELKAGAALA